MSPHHEERITDDKWKCAYEIFEHAVDLPAGERLAFARSALGDPEVINLAVELIEDVQDEDAQWPAALAPKPGDRIGRYEITGKLGQGGMGSVYSALDTGLGRVAALKMLAPGLAGTKSAAERMVREARAASALNHPCIVTVYEVIRIDGQAVLAMELIEGTPLRSYCKQAQPVARVIEWGRQIAQALAAAHARRIVHRDIKPENVMVRPDGYLKVLDFGLARRIIPSGEAASNISGMPGGTLNYMSPEQTRGCAATSASDIFSLGVMLYEMATGTHPFATGSGLDTAHAIVQREPKKASAVNRKVPSGLAALIGSMLDKDPEARPCAEEVDRRLAAMLDLDHNREPLLARTWLWARGLAVCIICSFVLWAIWTKVFVPREPVMRQVTTQASENRVTTAALSPDGKDLAFGTVGGPVHLRRMSDGFTKPLSTPAGLRVDRIAWFSDGSRVLVSGALASGSGMRGIWVVPVNGGDAILIFQNCEDAVPSPDGTRIAMTSADGAAIWVLGVNGGKSRQIRAGGDNSRFSALVWSPDSKRISYEHLKYAPQGRQVAAMAPAEFEPNYTYSYEAVEADTGRVIASVKDLIMTSACALKDGRILFLRWVSVAETFNHNVWELRTDPKTGTVLGSPRKVTHRTDTSLTSISAAYDGKSIAVVRGFAQSNIYAADVSQGAVPSLSNIRRVTFAASDDYPHAWTPDSRAIIFESSRNGNFDLFRQELDDRDAKPLVLSRADNVLAQTSPDGRWVLYREERERHAKRTLMRVPINGGTAEPVPKTGNVEEFRCGLQPGSRCVLRSTEDGQFVFYDLDPLQGKGRELARTVWAPSVAGDWDISPDGRFVAIPNHSSEYAKIRLISLDPSGPLQAERVVPLDGVKNLNGLVWAANGRGWYVAEIRSPGVVLLYVNDRGESWELLKSPVTMYAVPSPDGRKIAFPRGTASSNVWLLNSF